MSETHNHVWTPATHDGKPRFDLRLFAESAMRARCCECGEQALFTRDAWDSMNEATEAKEGA